MHVWYVDEKWVNICADWWMSQLYKHTGLFVISEPKKEKKKI